MAQATISASDLEGLLNAAFTGIKGVGADVIQRISASYAPRIAAIGSHGEDASDEKDDILENASLDLADAGVAAETVGAQLIISGLQLAISVALKFATAAIVA